MHPLVYAGPRHGQAADRADRRDAARDRPLHRHRRLGLGVKRWSARCRSTRRTSAGWDATRWLNTATWLARFNLTAQMIGPERVLDPVDGEGRGATRER